MSAQYKAPSAGTKVEPGSAAPTRSEATGPVPAGSLAAESASQGGEFANNRGVDASNTSSNNNSSSRTGTGAAPGSGASSVPGQAGTAPTYVNNQYIRDPNGPHGKNISEGFDTKNTKDGVQAAFNAEVGSENDPGRVAEQGFQQSQTKAGRDAGPRQTEVSGQTVYENLKSDVQA
ncbi:hypothetical protein ColTof4_12878 [Colletotrichum tofieldiae]|uniref:Uncharacterized protein n=1 Tax=Colletotrichum tofieldiae TaxID=708197 RepID=A0A166SM92_9PEZI|nr:hypothetical protein CT0861_01312 [Colletotrichum tofieldiae]GKT66933.1 hypothetical protein ColTof3_14272 [Colletotrichum tofieldiae]GKT80455.1 hypothetical protein ColTof4_12878 [Colletotrichum tofieldiae]GKT94815.1 hypothetical protein Ct61P_12665 [Colletotrichum tofieldiae]